MNARHLIGAAAAAALALPAAAHADTSVIGGPLKVRDYQMTVIGSDAAQDSLMVLFSRTSGGSSQQHMYSFDSGVTVTPTSIKGSLGRFGAVNLKLSGAKTAKGSVPAGCSGNAGTTKRGTLKGSFKLVADTTYFKTVTASSLKGMAASGGSIRCEGSGTSSVPGAGGGAGPMLMLSSEDAAGMLTFSATKDDQTVMRMDDAAATAPASIMHIISAHDAGQGLDLRSGGYVGTNGIRPFLGGGDTFEDDALSGTLSADFDSIGSIAIKGDATFLG